MTNAGTFARNFSQGTFFTTNGTLLFTPTTLSIGTNYFQINVTDGYGSISSINFTINVAQPLILMTPANLSTTASTTVTIGWEEYPIYSPYTYQLSTDSDFINVITSGTGTTNSSGYGTATISLSYSTDYYWHVKNATGAYTDWFKFTTPSAPVTPGTLNISVWDEQNITEQVMVYTATLYGTDHSVVTKSTTSGWTNFTSSEVSAQQYLIVINPAAPHDIMRQVLTISPSVTDIKLYAPTTLNNNTIDVVAFNLLDITGRFPFATSTITILRGGLVMEKAYFDATGSHTAYLIQGTVYQIQVQHGSDIYYGQTFIPTSSGTSTITINDFGVNTTLMNPFLYNITYNPTQVVLSWNDVGNVLNQLNYTVVKGNQTVPLCHQITGTKAGTIPCTIDNTTQYYVIFSALLNDGSYRNSSLVIDYTIGQIKTQTGVSTIDGSPIGVGYRWNYGTFTMPLWVYNWASLILIILLGGSIGGYFGALGGIITLIMALILEGVGWFRPLGASDSSNMITMGITGGLAVMTVLYYLVHKDRGG